MGERKVLNKYYSPDFDPTKLPRSRTTKNSQNKVRNMLSMTIRCNTLRARHIWEFKFSDSMPNAPAARLTVKTDPKNSDYVVESGATRSFEPWRVEDKEIVERKKKKREYEEIGDAMKYLENKTLESKREMDILAALDEMISMKSRHATVSYDKMLAALQRTAADKEKRLVEEDEELIKSAFSNNSRVSISRIRDGHGKTSNDNPKRRKTLKDRLEKAADSDKSRFE